MTRARLLLVALVLSLGAGAAALTRHTDTAEQASSRPAGTDYKGPAFTFNKITEGVYLAIGTGNLVVMSNAAIIEGDRDVLVVDSHVTPGGAWALREELKAVTNKPIRFVVNSHFHFDHSHGNQIYGPDVEIIGHEFARAQIRGWQIARLTRARVLRRRRAECDQGSRGPSCGGHRRKGARHDPGATRRAAQPPRGHQSREADAAHRNAHADDDAPSGLARDSHHAPRPRAHGGRRHRLSAKGTNRRDGRSARRSDVLHGRRVLHRVDRHDGRVEASSISTPCCPGTAARSPARPNSITGRRTCATSGRRRRSSTRPGCPGKKRPSKSTSAPTPSNYPTIRAAGITPNHGMLRAYEILDGKIK